MREQLDRYIHFSSLDECVRQAAKVFMQQRWNWSRCGIPDEMEIRQQLMYLRSAGNGIESGRLIYKDGRYGFQKPRVGTPDDHLDRTSFDYRTFNPANRKQHNSLVVLRSVGAHRARYMRGICRNRIHVRCCGSGSLRTLPDFSEERQGTYIDLGCGDSPDVLIATGTGYKAFGVDLFPPRHLFPLYIQANVLAVPLPNESADYLTSQAVIDLISPDERVKFYREAIRLLKIGGWFCQIGVGLHCGHGYKIGEEHERAISLNQWQVESIGNGFRAQRIE